MIKPNDIIACFILAAEKHNCIHAFIHGEAQREVSATRSRISYPYLLLERFEERYDSVKCNWVIRGAFVVLSNVCRENYQEEDDVLNETHGIMHDVMTLLKHGGCAEPLKKNKGFKWGTMIPVCADNMDNNWGWRVEWELRSPESTCVAPENYTLDPCPGLEAQFSYCYEPTDLNTLGQPIGDGGFLTLTDFSNEAESYEWTFKVKDCIVHTVKDKKVDPIPLSTFWDTDERCLLPVEIILKVCKTLNAGTDDEVVCCKYARAYLLPCKHKGQSCYWHPINCNDEDFHIQPGG